MSASQTSDVKQSEHSTGANAKQTAKRKLKLEPLDPAETFFVRAVAFGPRGFVQSRRTLSGREISEQCSWRKVLGDWAADFLAALPALCPPMKVAATIESAAFYPVPLPPVDADNIARSASSEECVALLEVKTRDEAHDTESTYVFRVAPGEPPVIKMLRLERGTGKPGADPEDEAEDKKIFFDCEPPGEGRRVFFAVRWNDIEAYDADRLALVAKWPAPPHAELLAVAARDGKLFSCVTPEPENTAAAVWLTSASSAPTRPSVAAAKDLFLVRNLTVGIKQIEPLGGGRAVIFTSEDGVALLSPSLEVEAEKFFVAENTWVACIARPVRALGAAEPEVLIVETTTTLYKTEHWKVSVW